MRRLVLAISMTSGQHPGTFMEELIHNFGIDWKLIIAQAINFFILLFVLWKFAYGPILKMLDKRKEDIKRGIEYTEKAQRELQQIGELREETVKTAKNEALSIVTSAEETGKKRKDQIIFDANKKVEGIVSDAKRLIDEEKAKMGEVVYKNAQNLVALGLGRVLGKMPTGERDQHLIEEALRELKATKHR